MCLYAHNTEPLVSDKDLAVCKMLKRKGGKYFTPFLKAEAKLGETLRAAGEFPSLPPDYSSNEVKGGVIHASVNADNCRSWISEGEDGEGFENVAVGAVIKAGTPFFVDLSLDDIAAAEMELSEQTMARDDELGLEATVEALKGLMLAQGFMNGNGGVRVGDVLLSDCKTFVHAGDIARGMEFIGIVAFIRADGKPQAMGLGQTGTELINDVAFKWCSEYKTKGTEPGDWHCPSKEEMAQAARNIALINGTASKLAEMMPDARWLMQGSYYFASTGGGGRCYVSTITTKAFEDSRFLYLYAVPMLCVEKIKNF